MFGINDPLRDPPFLGLDLIRCSNLLGLMPPDGQRKLVTGFQLALREHSGFLVPGEHDPRAAIENGFQEFPGVPGLYRVGQCRTQSSFRLGGGTTEAQSGSLAAIDNSFRKPLEEAALLSTRIGAVAALPECDEPEPGRAEATRRIARLTPRERDVMEHVIAGRANKEIAAQLRISQRTVETHRAKVMKKLGVTCLPELVRAVLAARGDESRA